MLCLLYDTVTHLLTLSFLFVSFSRFLLQRDQETPDSLPRLNFPGLSFSRMVPWFMFENICFLKFPGFFFFFF